MGLAICCESRIGRICWRTRRESKERSQGCHYRCRYQLLGWEDPGRNRLVEQENQDVSFGCAIAERRHLRKGKGLGPTVICFPHLLFLCLFPTTSIMHMY